LNSSDNVHEIIIYLLLTGRIIVNLIIIQFIHVNAKAGTEFATSIIMDLTSVPNSKPLLIARSVIVARRFLLERERSKVSRIPTIIILKREGQTCDDDVSRVEKTGG